MEIIEDAAGIKLRETIPRIIPVANPAAGADWSVNVPGGSLWQVLSVIGTLTTSAVVANRLPRVQASDGTTIFARIPIGAAIVASTGAHLSWLYGIGTAFQTGTEFASTLPPKGLLVFSGCTVSVSTLAIDVGDQWSAISVYVLETEERPYDVELNADLAQLRGLTSNAFPQIRESI